MIVAIIVLAIAVIAEGMAISNLSENDFMTVDCLDGLTDKVHKLADAHNELCKVTESLVEAVDRAGYPIGPSKIDRYDE